MGGEKSGGIDWEVIIQISLYLRCSNSLYNNVDFAPFRIADPPNPFHRGTAKRVKSVAASAHIKTHD